LHFSQKFFTIDESMDLTDELSDNSPRGDRQDEQAVIICLQFPKGKLKQEKALAAIFELDAIFREIIEASGVGNYGGNEFAESDIEESVTFYLYGDDATKMYHEVQPILDSLPSLTGFYIIKRYSALSESNTSIIS
jgi:hypothetical protein